ncbi:cell division control protein 42 homolog [Mytilus californianus]|uniref:cell division control protein 42 homolog n=1 Tax=Mytilus californianus TaxID=6549 RepID=UPI0022465E90|nr:cell division control protein 42 homolog [Mytilus californianus]
MMTKKGPKEVKCVLVGDGGVGKTSMILSYTTGKIMTSYEPTCFDDYLVNIHTHNGQEKMQVSDTAGQETYDRLRTLSYYDTDVFIVCFSVEDKDSLENVKIKWIPEVKEFRPNTPFILVGTQTDLRGSVTDITDACVKTTKGKKLAKKFGAVDYLECSALELNGMDEIFTAAYHAAVTPKKKRRVWKSFKSAFKRKSVAGK